MSKTLLNILLAFAALQALHAVAAEKQPLRALHLTSFGYYHDYLYQTQSLTQLFARQLRVSLDTSLDELARWRTTDFAQGYDLLIINFCLGKQTNETLLNNVRRQIEQLKVPTNTLHDALLPRPSRRAPKCLGHLL